ncbi:hypothetical protein ACFY3U_03470 [Micromonospora sp. NPDC000089]|uniref:hypothetical protein n=1 Tax=unclassified Micromonospora TaxID=2617518 RepID=UPI003697A96C
MTSSESDRAASRRTVLRRAAVTGGAAVAATAATAVDAAPASAAAGDPVTIGLSNAGVTPTTITSAAPDGAATLALRNDTGATLQLTDSNSWQLQNPRGCIGVSPSGLFVNNGNGANSVFSTANATMLVPVPPTRILDSRSAAGRARLLEGGARIDARGRVLAETMLVVHLADIVEYGDGMLGNITVADTERAGFATVWGTGDLPTSSTINWWTTGQLLSNGVITQLGDYSTVGGDYYPDTVAIYVQKSATAVILDVTGLLVFHPESAVINNPKAASGARLAADSGGRAARAQAIKRAAESGNRAVRTDA